MIRLFDLIQLPDPFPPQSLPTIGSSELETLIQQGHRLVALCISTGVLNDEDAEKFANDLDDLVAQISDLQHRLTLNETFDGGDCYDLRVTWRKEYQKFLRFRDIIRSTLNLMVQDDLVAVENSDEVKEDVDDFYQQMVEINKTVSRVLQRL